MGELTEDDLAIGALVEEAFDRLQARHLSRAAQARRGRATYGDPPEFDPANLRIDRIRRLRASRVEISAIHDRPELAGLPADLREQRLRYDLVREGDAWRLDNRLSIVPGERPIGGLF